MLVGVGVSVGAGVSEGTGVSVDAGSAVKVSERLTRATGDGASVWGRAVHAAATATPRIIKVAAKSFPTRANLKVTNAHGNRSGMGFSLCAAKFEGKLMLLIISQRRWVFKRRTTTCFAGHIAVYSRF